MIETFLARDLVQRALTEDLLYGDKTTEALFPEPFPALGVVIAKETLVLAGIDIFLLVFKTLDATVTIESMHSEGEVVKKGGLIARIKGDGRMILKGERTALNFLQRLSGIATLTRKYVKSIEGTLAEVVDTRKTTPGYRALEKRAVGLGGGRNHRFHLGDLILIKDNHIVLAGGIKKAVACARLNLSHSLKIEVEVNSLTEVQEAIEGDVEIIMLDNMNLTEIADAVTLIRTKAPKVLIEVSGGVDLEQMGGIAKCGVDLISVGALTHSAKAVDISLEVESMISR